MLPQKSVQMLTGREEARQIYEEIYREFGSLTLKEHIFNRASLIMAAWTWFSKKFGIFQQPSLLRVEYPRNLGPCAAALTDQYRELITAGKTCGEYDPSLRFRRL